MLLEKVATDVSSGLLLRVCKCKSAPAISYCEDIGIMFGWPQDLGDQSNAIDPKQPR